MREALENKLLFYPRTAAQDWIDPAENPLAVDDVHFKSHDGTHLHAWWCPTRQKSDGAMLLCHGNAGNISHRGRLIKGWLDHLAMPVFAFDYPGYGKSSGKSSESGCYAAAEAGYDWIINNRGIAPQEIIIAGESLGGAVAVDLACRRPHRMLVLISSFTSVLDVAHGIYPWLPVRWLLRNRFDNLAKIGKCRRPIFIAHGTADHFIPYRHAERLFAAASEPKRLLLLPEHEHNSLLTDEFYVQVRQFMQQTA